MKVVFVASNLQIMIFLSEDLKYKKNYPYLMPLSNWLVLFVLASHR